jgi:hypothetical protein
MIFDEGSVPLAHRICVENRFPREPLRALLKTGKWATVMTVVDVRRLVNGFEAAIAGT